jgi:hypothetical protein
MHKHVIYIMPAIQTSNASNAMLPNNILTITHPNLTPNTLPLHHSATISPDTPINHTKTASIMKIGPASEQHRPNN